MIGCVVIRDILILADRGGSELGTRRAGHSFGCERCVGEPDLKAIANTSVGKPAKAV